MEGKQCKIDAKIFASGSEVCDETLCYVCQDGLWQQKSTLELEVRP
jgi:hypothetical protein